MLYLISYILYLISYILYLISYILYILYLISYILYLVSYILDLISYIVCIYYILYVIYYNYILYLTRLRLVCVAWCCGGGHVKWCHEVAKPVRALFFFFLFPFQFFGLFMPLPWRS